MFSCNHACIHTYNHLNIQILLSHKHQDQLTATQSLSNQSSKGCRSITSTLHVLRSRFAARFYHSTGSSTAGFSASEPSSSTEVICHSTKPVGRFTSCHLSVLVVDCSPNLIACSCSRPRLQDKPMSHCPQFRNDVLSKSASKFLPVCCSELWSRKRLE